MSPKLPMEGISQVPWQALAWAHENKRHSCVHGCHWSKPLISPRMPTRNWLRDLSKGRFNVWLMFNVYTWEVCFSILNRILNHLGMITSGVLFFIILGLLSLASWPPSSVTKTLYHCLSEALPCNSIRPKLSHSKPPCSAL